MLQLSNQSRNQQQAVKLYRSQGSPTIFRPTCSQIDLWCDVAFLYQPTEWHTEVADTTDCTLYDPLAVIIVNTKHFPFIGHGSQSNLK